MNALPTKPVPVYFNIGPYRFMFGPSSIHDHHTTLPKFIQTFTLWMWNGYYWQVEIADCPNGDPEDAKYAMQFKIAEWKAHLNQ